MFLILDIALMHPEAEPERKTFQYHQKLKINK